MTKEGDLQIWHNSNFGHPAFRESVKNTDEARDKLNTLAMYDLYQGEEKVPVNSQGLEVFEDGEWCEWMDDDGFFITEI